MANPSSTTAKGHTGELTQLGLFLVLLALTATTISVSFFELGPWNLVINLAIALTQATILGLFFMDLRHGDRLTWLVVAAAFFWVAILFGLTLTDYVTRQFGGVL